MAEQKSLPNSNAVLVLGILSIPIGFCCYSFFAGFIIGIIAIVISNTSLKLYNKHPELYSDYSLKNLNAGRICAIIGVVLSSLWIMAVIFYLIFFGSFISDEIMMEFNRFYHL